MTKGKTKPSTWGCLVLIFIIVVVWLVTEFAPPKKEVTPFFEDLPAYQIINRVDMISGKKYADVLIISFSKRTPEWRRESILRRIAKQEGFTEASLYCTMDAYSADMSASYLKAHPDALEEGYLGSLRDGKFNMGSWEF